MPYRNDRGKYLSYEFGIPSESGGEINNLLDNQRIKFEYAGDAGGFSYFIFSNKTNYYKAVHLIEKNFKNAIETDEDWIEWRR